MRTVSSNHAASGCYFGISLPLLRHMATMDTLAALYLSICATGAGAATDHTLRRQHGCSSASKLRAEVSTVYGVDAGRW